MGRCPILITLIVKDEEYTLSTPKWICLWARISTKDTNHVFTHNTRFTLHILQLSVFFRFTMWPEYCPAGLDTILLTFSQKKRGR